MTLPDLTLMEIIALIGAGQSLFIFMYLVLRARPLMHAASAILYFSVLIIGFLSYIQFIPLDMSLRLEMQWLVWALGPPLTYALIRQLSVLNRRPHLVDYWPIGLVLMAGVLAQFIVSREGQCGFLQSCAVYDEWVRVFSTVGGALCLLSLWWNTTLLKQVKNQPNGDERFWLILSLVVITILLQSVIIIELTDLLTMTQADGLKLLLGLGFVYVAATMLFRIYPQPIALTRNATKQLSPSEEKIANQIADLLILDKVYHEPSYSRSNMANELNVPEITISKIINHRFGKTFPMVLNEYRVTDAQQLLRETNATVQVIAAEVGFNSIVSFNRAFKSITQMTAMQYRETHQTLDPNLIG